MWPEDVNREFKREYTEGVKRTIVAFANTDGGTLYIGVEDDGSVCGVPDVDATMLQVTNSVREAVRPDVTMFVECRAELRGGREVVAVRVSRGTARPYYLAGKGIRPAGVFVRHGASTVPASEAAILRMIRETGGDSFEESRSLLQELTFATASAHFAAKGVEFGDAQLRTLHLRDADGTFTNLALLLSDQCQHTIKIAVFEGTTKMVFRDRRELGGSLLQQVDDAYAVIDRYNRIHAVYVGVNRIDIRDYPEEAVREALINALVHREYAFSDATLISIFDDRMEFVNLGGLVKGVTRADILLGVSALRNKYLANIFYRLRLVEAYGTGMLKIQQAYADTVVTPCIEISDNAFKVTLPNVNVFDGGKPQAARLERRNVVGERERKVLELVRQRGRVRRSEVQETLQVSQATAVVLLRDMVAAGVLHPQGNGPARVYVLGQRNA